MSNNSENSAANSWEIPVLKTSATKEEGIGPVIAAISQHFDYLHQSGELANRARTRLIDELETTLQTVLIERLVSQLPPDYLSQIVDKLASRSLSPYTAVQEILKTKGNQE